MANVTSDQVWRELRHQNFGVLGFVTPNAEGRTAGVCYVVDGHTILIASWSKGWKVRHIGDNPRVSLTVTVPRRFLFLPFMKVPPATITLNGTAYVMALAEAPKWATDELLVGPELTDEQLAETCLIKIVPRGDFVTYGISTSIMAMRHPADAVGRAPVGTSEPVNWVAA